MSERFYARTVATWIARRRTRVLADVGSWLRTNPGKPGVLAQGLPWLNFELIDALESRLSGGERSVFEWGSGGSTVFFGERASRVVTVEHDAAWVAAVRRELAARQVHTVRLRHVAEQPDATWDGPVPPLLRRRKLAAFRDYIGPLDATEERYDIVMVDGKARLECLKAAAGRVRSDGWIVLDDTDMPGRLASARKVLPAPEWHCRLTVGPGPASGWRLLTSAAVFTRRA